MEWLSRLGKKETTVKVLLYFKEDLSDVFTKHEIEYPNEPSWVLEIVGLNEQERDTVKTKYDRLRRSLTRAWVIGESALIDFEPGSQEQFHDVSRFFDTLNELGYESSPVNPAPNTSGMDQGEVRSWAFTKLS